MQNDSMPLPDRLPDDFPIQADSEQVLRNRYVLGKKLGAGNFGTAYLVSDKKPKENEDKSKVLKQIHVGPLDPGETVGAMREAHLLSSMHHKNIVQFHESFLEGPYFCIITEFCDGGDLDIILRGYKNTKRIVEEVQVVDWLKQLLKALEYMHDKRILHRDLKTKNIFLKNNQIKIGDFGISRILMGTSDMATTFVGTPYYMSPEVLQHEKYDVKSDMWSLGCVLYEICCLKHAFEGQSLMAVMYKIVTGEVPELPETYSRALNIVLHKMLDKESSKRQTAKQVLQHGIFSVQSGKFGRQGLTPRERLKLKKQKNADENYRRHKELAEKNFRENQRRHKESVTRNFHHTFIESPSTSADKKSVRTKSADSKYLPGIEIPPKEEDGVFDDELETLHPQGVSNNAKFGFPMSKTHNPTQGVDKKIYSSSTMPAGGGGGDFHGLDGNKTLEGTSLEISFDGESTTELAMSLVKDGYIPENALLAETYYTLEPGFEELDSSDFDNESDLDLPEDVVHLSDTEYKEMLEFMEEALVLDESITEKPRNGAVEDVGMASALVHSVVDGQIANLRKSCLDAMGQDVFERAYKYLRSIWSNHIMPSAPDYTMAMQKLQDIVHDDKKCFMLEQLVYRENEKAMQGY